MEKKFPVSGNNRKQIFACLAALWVFLGISLFLLPSPPSSHAVEKEARIRKSAVAGAFYPGSKAALEKTVDEYLRQVQIPRIEGTIRAIMVPHAGYVYSGGVAAHAYKALEGQELRTVVLMCNSHTDSFDGISVYKEGYFETPLGLVPIDQARAEKLIAANPKIMDRPSAHAQDHVLEVQLPFLQRVLKNFKIVPILFGSDNPELPKILAEALKSEIDDKTLLIASSDMSHYPSYHDAKEADRKTIDAILSGDPAALDATLRSLEAQGIRNTSTFLCGVSGVRTVMALAKDLGANHMTLLSEANSGDTSGDRSRVVGYSAIAFIQSQEKAKPAAAKTDPEEGILNNEEQKELLKIARSTVESYIREDATPSFSPSSPNLNAPLGAFVTLRKHGQLRGCIGRFEPAIPLYQVVAQMAVAAATEDPRFRPVTQNELNELDYEISVLSPLRKVKSADEIELGKHGVQVVKGFRGGVFLPQVATEFQWDKETFLSELCLEKAGLRADCWKDPSVNLYVFTAQVFSEEK
ncbi:MAG: AmmeMemoRadiSam system protein B [Candidatus Omnitrophota bacterium]